LSVYDDIVCKESFSSPAKEPAHFDDNRYAQRKSASPYRQADTHQDDPNGRTDEHKSDKPKPHEVDHQVKSVKVKSKQKVCSGKDEKPKVDIVQPTIKKELIA